MAYEKRDGDISVFRNDKKNGRQPDYRGELLLNGVTYEVALWSKRDGEILSGSVKVNERVRRDKETHDLIAGAAYLAAREENHEPLYETAAKMQAPQAPAPVEEEDDLPF